MAQRVITTLLCDLCDEETEGTGTLAFGVGNSQYEIDVCDRHNDEITTVLDRLKSVSRKAGRVPASVTPIRRQPTGILLAGDLTEDEREFALSQGWAGRRLSREISDAILAQRSKPKRSRSK